MLENYSKGCLIILCCLNKLTFLCQISARIIIYQRGKHKEMRVGGLIMSVGVFSL